MPTDTDSNPSQKTRISRSDTIQFLGALEQLQKLQDVQPPRILIVDDDKPHRESLITLLGLVGYECLSAGSGSEALAVLKRHHVDLLLLDLLMPGMDGHQLMELVRARNQDAAIIVISGDATWAAATKAMRRGADNFIRKPYAPDEVLVAIKRSLAQREQKKLLERKMVRQRVSEQLHRFIVDKSPDFIYILDASGCFRFVNERISDLLGYTREELLGCHFNSLLVDATVTEKVIFNTPRDVEKTVTLEVQFNKKPGMTSGNSDPVTVELTVQSAYYRDFTNGRRVFLGSYGVARDISMRKQVESQICYQAHHDHLTGLPNRSLFNDRLALAIKQARRNKGKIAVFFIDLDHFKTINDTLGHALGDRALEAIASRIENCIRRGDTLSRIGGDEFVLLMPQLKMEEDADNLARNIVEILQAPLCLGHHEVIITASIGIAVYPDHGRDANTLINHADLAMYEIKSRGKNNVGFYSPKLDKVHLSNLSFEVEMRNALERNEFIIEYQPQVRLGDGSIRGLEALVRWQHPTRGRLAPCDFIGKAEENQTILPLGNWVIEQVLHDVRNWRKQGIDPPVVAINVSALQLRQSNFTTVLVELLQRYDIPGHCIELELTENVIMQDVNDKMRCLKKVTDAGIRIAIDDFGTGYSSLSNLQRLPVDTLKMDQSFVDGINPATGENSMVSIIIAMARGLGLGLIAEGVEKPHQAQYLEQAGCRQGQGFLFSTPLNFSSTVRYLEQAPCGPVQ